MGYLNNSVVTVDAVLTKKGRELLARGDGSFRITQFALADDEIDYTLYNSSHPSGSAFYGEAIENMPLLEAFPDENQIMKYKLATLPRGTSKLPILEAGYASITLRQGASLAITPQTLNYLGATSTFEAGGYTATIADVRVLSNYTGVGINMAAKSHGVGARGRPGGLSLRAPGGAPGAPASALRGAGGRGKESAGFSRAQGARGKGGGRRRPRPGPA